MRKFYFSLLTVFLVLGGITKLSAQCTENFDGVVAPALPTGWTTDVTGIGVPWLTSTTSSFSAPNNSFGTETSNVGVTNYNSILFPINSPAAQLTFRNLFNLESGFDGMVLEIAIGAGPYQDILAAGGSFVVGGYNGTLSVNFANPLPGRQAWTGLSGGTTGAPAYIVTTVNLPAAANGQNVRFRWRVGSDNSLIAAGAAGVRIDDITITGCSFAVPCAENFDSALVPFLPVGWTAITALDCATSDPWATTTTSPDSPPNAAFVNNPTCTSDEILESRIFPITSASSVVTFRRNNSLESGFDGMVLEISIGGGPFVDILASGATFGVGGYNGVVSNCCGNPLATRSAWTGNSGGWVTTTVNLPAGANGQNVVLRWRRGTDFSVGGAGAWIDGISITGSLCAPIGCSGTPIPGSISGTDAACAGGSVTLTLNGAPPAPGLTRQWRVATVSGGPYTNIAGATGNSYNFTAAGGTFYYIVTTTCANGGATASTAEHRIDVGNLVHSGVSATVTTACSPGAATITGTASGGVLRTTYGSSGTINLAIPDNTPAGVNSVINMPGQNFLNAADLQVRITANHTWVGDLVFRLTTPCGVTYLFDRPGVPATIVGNSDNLGTSSGTTPPPGTYTFDLGAATVVPETNVGSGFIAPGSYRPSNAAGAAHNWSGMTFPCNSTGAWTLNISDNAGLDQGTLVSWQILGPAVYTHTLTGPGTIVQNPPTGAGNATGNFTITNIPFGTQTYTLKSVDAIGCSVTSTVNVLIKQTPVISFTQSPANPICNGQIQTITANVVPPVITSFSQFATTQIPLGSPSVSIGNGDPYPSTLTVSGLPASGATVRSVRIGNMSHTFPDDVDIVLVSPGGTAVVIMSDVGGGTDIAAFDYTFEDGAASLMSTSALNPSGTYRPTNFETPETWPAPGPGSLNQPTPTLSSFGSGNHNGTWRLYIVDDANGDVGFVGNWTVTFNVPPTVTFTPFTGLYLNSSATTPYNGEPVTVVYAKPTTTTTYTASATVDGCSNTNTVTVQVNQLPAITVQPTPATQTVCPGQNVQYSVTATGTGISYQWQRNAVNLVNNAQIFGATSPTLTILNVAAANSGTYTVIVSGVCTPAATSTPVVLNVATAPVISTQPANQTRCVGQNAVFTVANVGSVPPPTIFQWESSPDGVAPYTPLTTGGSYTATFTLSNVQLSDNNRRFRVRVTNSCGQTTVSNAAILTVNANPVVTAAVLPKICLSDTLVPLVGTPVGGSWSGIGVSGFNFVPGATAVGTYTLTYTYTNAAGCTGTATTIAKVEDCGERIRLLSDDGVIVFPNPNDGRFNVKMNSTLYNYLGMRVYTTNGQLVAEKHWNGLYYGRVMPIDLTHLPSAAYMVKFFYDDGARTSEKTFKIIIGRN